MNYANLVAIPTYGIKDLDHPVVTMPAERPAVDFIRTPARQTCQAVRIARAKSGISELRLMQTVLDGVPSGYVLQTSQLSPYATDRKDLVSEADGQPLTEAEAIASFEAAVQHSYPAIELRNGATVATHLNLL